MGQTFPSKSVKLTRPENTVSKVWPWHVFEKLPGKTHVHINTPQDGLPTWLSQAGRGRGFDSHLLQHVILSLHR